MSARVATPPATNAKRRGAPATVGPYRLEERLGSGGMGEVYRAFDERLRRWVAIKQIHIREAAGAEARQQLRREARVVAGLNHPAIVQIHDVVETEPGDWIVMEWIDGRCLHDMVAEGPLAMRHALRLGREIAEGLEAAHAKGIVHRDLKTENVMVTRSGHAKILDFGLAKQLRHDPNGPSFSGHYWVRGTGRAMSPEQVHGTTVDHRSDLFSFGTLLYEMVTGQSPFLDASFVKTLMRVCSHQQPSAREINPQVPPALAALIDRLLEKDLDRRPQSATEVAQILGSIKPAPKDAPPAEAAEKLPGQGEEARVEARRRLSRTKLLAGLAIGVVALAAAVWLLPIRTPAPEGRAGGGEAAGTRIADRAAVAVWGFTNLGSPEAAWVATALAQMLASELAVGEDLRLISGESVERIKRDVAFPEGDVIPARVLAAIGEKLGTDHLIFGSYLVETDEEGERLVLHLRLQSTGGGEPFLLEETVPLADLLELVPRTGRILRRQLGVAEVPATASAIPEVNRLYAEGVAKLRRCDAPGARQLLAEAVAADPDYGLAHAALSEAWRALGYDEKALASATRALELASGLPRAEALAIQGQYYVAAADWAKAASTYQVLWGFFPDRLDLGLRLAEALTNAGRGRQALTTVAALRQLPPPEGDDPRIDLTEAWAARSLSEFDRELAALERAIAKGRARELGMLVAEALSRQGWVLRRLGRPQAAAATLAEATALFVAAGNRGKVAEVLLHRALLLENQGDGATAEPLVREALAVHRQTGNRRSTAAAITALVGRLHERGELARARELCAEALELARQSGDRRHEAGILAATAGVALDQGRPAEAEALVLRALAIGREIGSRELLARSFSLWGEIAVATGDVAAARARHEEALVLAREIGFRRLVGWVLERQATTLLAAGELAAAEPAAAECRKIRQELGELGAEIELTQARIRLAQGRPAAAETLAREAAAELERQEIAALTAEAHHLLARIYAAQGKLAAARQLLVGVREVATKSELPAFRLAVEITTARLLAAAGEPDEARRRLILARAEAVGLGLIATALEARLALVEIAGGMSADPALRAQLLALAAEAETRGFGHIARRAGELAPNANPGSGVLYNNQG